MEWKYIKHYFENLKDDDEILITDNGKDVYILEMINEKEYIGYSQYKNIVTIKI